MAAAPVFAVTPKIGIGQVSAANTALDGSGTVVTILTGGTNGTKISEIVTEGAGTTSATMVRLFLFDGTNTRLFDEISVAAATPSASVKANRVSTFYQNLTLPNNNWQLRASTHTATAVNVFAFAADL
jgi:hypothetical protein